MTSLSLNGNVLHQETIVPGRAKGYGRFIVIRERLRHLLRETKPTFCFIEEYAFKARGKARSVLQELGGVVNVMLHEEGIPAFRIPPMTLKILATDKGNASKEEVIASARSLGVLDADEHQCDAYFLARIGLMLISGHGVPVLTKKQVESLNKMKKWWKNSKAPSDIG